MLHLLRKTFSFLEFTVLCKKNANEVRRNSFFVLTEKSPKFRTIRELSAEISGEPRQNSITSRKFAESRAKFRSGFVCTVAEFRIAALKFEILKRNFARLGGPRVIVFQMTGGVYKLITTCQL